MTPKPNRSLKYDYGSTQVDLPPALAKRVKAWARTWIPKEVLTGDGYETAPHVTVRYGLTGTPGKAQKAALTAALAPLGPIRAHLRNVECFDTNPDFDVLYLSVESEQLTAANKAVKAAVACTDTHPGYTPHITLAYVEKGKGHDLVGSEPFTGEEVVFDTVLLSDRRGRKTAIRLTGQKAPAVRKGLGLIAITRKSVANEPRDAKGRWTRGNTGVGTEYVHNPQEHLGDKEQLCVNMSLRAFGLDPKKRIRYVDEAYKYMKEHGFQCRWLVDEILTGWNPKPTVTFRAFANAHPTGKFILFNHNHGVALIDGRLTDTEGRGFDGRIIQLGFEVTGGPSAEVKKGLGLVAVVMKAITSHPYADVHEALVKKYGTIDPKHAPDKGAHFVLPDGRMTGDMVGHYDGAVHALKATGKLDPYREDGLSPEDEVMHHGGVARVRMGYGGVATAVEHQQNLTGPQAKTLATIGAHKPGPFVHDSFHRHEDGKLSPVSYGETYADFMDSPAVKRVMKGITKGLPHDASPYADVTEMVPIAAVKKFREYDRARSPRDHAEFAALKADIAQHGIKEPLMLDYQHNKKIATLGEGNHRLAAAESLGHTHVPVRVARSHSVEYRPHAKVSGYDLKPKTVNGQEYPGHLPGDMKPSEIGVGEGMQKGIDGEPDPKHMAADPGAGKFNEAAFHSLHALHQGIHTSRDLYVNHKAGTLGDYLKGRKTRALYAAALDTPVVVSNQPHRRDSLAFAHAGNAFHGTPATITFNAHHSADMVNHKNALLHEAAHVLRMKKGRTNEHADDPHATPLAQYDAYRNSVHERTARKMANHALLGVDETKKSIRVAVLLRKSVRAGVRPGEVHPTMPHLPPSTAEARAIVKERGHKPVPPASWGLHVSPDPNAKVQATFYDAKGRRQSTYHNDHTVAAASHKFERLSHFADQLPHIQAKVHADLQKEDAHPDRVRAAVVRLMDHSAIRVGGAKYAEENGSYGASSLRKEHVHLGEDGHSVHLKFPGKHGVTQEAGISDPHLHAALTHFKSLPGDAMFQQRTRSGGLSPVNEGHVNDYLHEFGVHAHQFRHHAATEIARAHLSAAPWSDNPKERAKHVKGAAQKASDRLGNSPTMALASYIHPGVVADYHAGTLHDH